MGMRQQLIIIGAVIFATVSVAASVFAGVRATSARQEQRPFIDIPIAVVGDAGPELATPEPGAPQAGTARNTDGSNSRHEPNAPSAASVARNNHGRMVSAAAYAAHIGFTEREDGPPGALVRTIARPNVQVDGAPRSDRAEQRRNGNAGSSSSEHGQNGNGHFNRGH